MSTHIAHCHFIYCEKGKKVRMVWNCRSQVMNRFLHILVLLEISHQGGKLLVGGADYNDTISCENFPSVENITDSELEQEAQRLGQCIPYIESDRPNPCDEFYTIGVDMVYLPNGRALDNLPTINAFAADASLVVEILPEQCRDPGARAICYYYYPPCGNITQFEPPNALCQDVCLYLTTELCQQEWLLALQHLASLEDFLEEFQIQFLNCSQPGSPLGDLPHCCSDAGVTIIPDSTPGTAETGSTFSIPNSNSDVVAASVATVVAVLLLLVGVAFATTLCLVVKRRENNRKVILRKVKGDKNTLPELIITDDPSQTPKRYVPATPGLGMVEPQSRARVGSGFIRNLTESKLIIPGRHLQLLETVGQGEFGVVYRGHLTGWNGRTTAELVAVKTLKNLSSASDANNLMKESEKMEKFENANVLNLIGVCIDAGEAPYIVMPYMANGSLLAYLRKERPRLTIAEGAGDEVVTEAQRKLLSICLQIAKGMSYLAEQKFVHRDLAARNCMIDQNFVIKVADFGLSEDIYSRNYFRQGQVDGGESVKLPIRWMALESLLDSVFTEKTDVWSYGVTCWEVFSLGHTPYPAIDPFALIKFLQSGERLEKPINASCTPQVYELICQCWAESPDERPSFQDLSQAVNSFLEGIAGYLDFSAFSSASGAGQNGRYDHLEKRVVNGGYDHLESN